MYNTVICEHQPRVRVLGGTVIEGNDLNGQIAQRLFASVIPPPLSRRFLYRSSSPQAMNKLKRLMIATFGSHQTTLSFFVLAEKRRLIFGF